ncbi:hypothetical protein J6590_026090 [Homalodisca vitripennis]|nr:hypothetical protein J6590_026090 [Homalodisca vitripennis]
MRSRDGAVDTGGLVTWAKRRWRSVRPVGAVAARSASAAAVDDPVLTTCVPSPDLQSCPLQEIRQFITGFLNYIQETTCQSR